MRSSSPLPWASLLAALTLAACGSVPLGSARMALPPELADAPALPFAGLPPGKRGRFVLDGQAVEFRRTGDALSVFDLLRLDRVALEFESGPRQGRCDGRGSNVRIGLVDTAAQPLEVVCRFSGTATGERAGELVLREPRLAGGGTLKAREGRATWGPVLIEVRSEHRLQGSPLPLPQPAGYRLQAAGREVAALELTGGTPVLRRAAGLDEATSSAVTQTALALGLMFDPAVTLR